MNAETELTPDGMLKGKIEIAAEGQSDAMLRRALKSYKSGQEEYIPSILKRSFPHIKIDAYTCPDIEDLSKPIAITIDFEISDFAIVDGEELTFTPLAAANPFSDYYNAAELFISTNDKEKNYGFTARCSKLVQIKEKLKLPEGFKIKSKPENINSEGVCAAYNSSYTLKGNMLEFSQEHKMNKRVYEAADWKEFREALLGRKKIANSPVVIKK